MPTSGSNPQPAYGINILLSCYEATLLWRGQAAVDEAAAP